MTDTTTTVRHRENVPRAIRQFLFRRVRGTLDEWAEVRECQEQIDRRGKELAKVEMQQAKAGHEIESGFHRGAARLKLVLAKNSHEKLTYQLRESHQRVHVLMHKLTRFDTKQIQVPRQGVCAAPTRCPRTRRSHRVVRTAKSAAGDSGDPDPEPEPPGNLRCLPAEVAQ